MEVIAAQIRAESKSTGPRLLAVKRKDNGDIIGYCGLIVDGNGSRDEPELAYELLRAAHGHGYATEAGWAVVTRASEAGYRRLWAGVRDWMPPRGASWRRSGSARRAEWTLTRYTAPTY
ncbi:MAG: GNAT family N-acetyltransferase [Ornithinimicrobium sp.]